MPVEIKEIYINIGITILLLLSSLILFGLSKREELEKMVSGTSRWAGIVKSEKDKFSLLGRYGYRMYILSLFVALPFTVYNAINYCSNLKASLAITGLTFLIMIVIYKYPIKAFIYFKK